MQSENIIFLPHCIYERINVIHDFCSMDLETFIKKEFTIAFYHIAMHSYIQKNEISMSSESNYLF